MKEKNSDEIILEESSDESGSIEEEEDLSQIYTQFDDEVAQI